MHWLDAPQDHDYPAAAAYLALLAPAELVAELVTALHAAPALTQKAKDILRASRLPLLDRDNVHVAADLQKITKGQPLSPILLVRGSLTAGAALQVVDGYHRVCASYYTDENTDIPCRLVAVPDPA